MHVCSYLACSPAAVHNSEVVRRCGQMAIWLGNHGKNIALAVSDGGIHCAMRKVGMLKMASKHDLVRIKLSIRGFMIQRRESLSGKVDLVLFAVFLPSDDLNE